MDNRVLIFLNIPMQQRTRYRKLDVEQFEPRYLAGGFTDSPAAEGGLYPVTIDVGVTFSSAAAAHIVGYGGTVRGYIEERLGETNDILSKSGVDVVFAALYIRPDDRPDAETHIDNVLLEAEEGGQKLRDKYGADLIVHLMGPRPSVCGASFAPQKEPSDHSAYASTAVVMPYCRRDVSDHNTILWTHEMGHLLGAQHAPDELSPAQSAAVLFSDGRAWSDVIDGTRYATIMQANAGNGVTILRFSNPDKNYVFPDGSTRQIGDDSTNNAGAMNAMAHAVAGYRTRQVILQNPTNHLDVNNDGVVTPLDVLVLINRINVHGSTGVLDMSEEAVDELMTKGTFPDVNGDNWITPVDPLTIINHLNSPQ